MKFIEQIVEHIQNTESCENLQNQLFLFPSKRAVALFNDLLQKYFENEVFVFPKVQTIQEFFIENSTFNVVDEYILLQELYFVNEAVTQTPQSFHQFIGWGKLVLKDFDEIDKYLVDTKYFFDVLLAHKEVDIHFNVDEIVKEYLESFYANIHNEKQGIFFEDFIQTWKYLGEIYNVFGQRLLEKNITYEGKSFRLLLKEIETKQKQLPYLKIHFCGFNAFTTCEKNLLDTLISQYAVNTWWDIDEDFIKNEFHEAGNFLRKYYQEYKGKQHHWISDKEQSKRIDVVAMPTNVGQVHYVWNAINLEENNCIVLCDENLMDYCLPIFNVETTNITMGLNIKKISVFELLNVYINLLDSITIVDDITYLKGESALSFFLSGLLEKQIPKRSELVKYLFGSEVISLPLVQTLIADDLYRLIAEPFNATTVLQNLLDLIQLSNTEPHIKQTLTEYISTIQYTTQQNIIQSSEDVLAILNMYVGNQSMAYETKLDSKVQIMGFLETRLQDFENIYILSLNDSIMPGTNRTNSFIPYNLRKSFRLPTFDQFDGINAYHFFRLLKRGKNITLIYNNSSIDNEEEKSRFIRQIEYDFENETIEQHAVLMKNNDDKKINKDIVFNKSEAIIDKLKERIFSPSSLKLYLSCPVQFYLKYIVGINEPKDLYANFDSAYFGTILHKILELYYSDFQKGIELKDTDIYFNQAIADSEIVPLNYYTGKKVLDKKVIKKLVLDILKNDKEEEFKIVGLEDELIAAVSVNNSEIKIKGKLDRVDKIDNTIRILDYKTGEVKLLTFPDENKKSKSKNGEPEVSETDKFFNKLFGMDNGGYPETFQGLMYAWLYSKSKDTNAKDLSISVGFYLAKKLQGGIQYLNDGNPIPIAILEEFEKRLIALLQEILDIKTPFIVNANSKSYQYSAYADLLSL